MIFCKLIFTRNEIKIGLALRVLYSVCYFVEVSDVSHPVKSSSPSHPSVVEFGLTSCEVELAIAEMACVSRNVRTTRPESLPAFRSNVPFLSAMSHILKRSIVFISHSCVREFLGNCTEEWL